MRFYQNPLEFKFVDINRMIKNQNVKKNRKQIRNLDNIEMSLQYKRLIKVYGHKQFVEDLSEGE